MNAIARAIRNIRLGWELYCLDWAIARGKRIDKQIASISAKLEKIEKRKRIKGEKK